jgi:hypothetical protein
MTPGQLLDEFTGLFAGGESSTMLRNLGMQMRDNPLPVTLVGAGLAWLMLGSGTPHVTNALPGGSAPRPAGAPDRIESEGLGSMFADAAETIAEAASGVRDTMSRTASDAAEAVTSNAAAVRSATGNTAMQAGRSARELLETQPLALAAAGLALGAAIGSVLPHSTVEDEQLGAYRDKLRDASKAVLDKGLEEAKQVAADAYETMKEEAGRQDMTAGTVADHVGEIVKSTANDTEQAVRKLTTASSPEKS